MMQHNQLPFDRFTYIVVGGGTAGCVTAFRLAQNPHCSVALLEAGPSDENIEDVLILRRWANLLGSELDYDYGIEEQKNGNSKMRHSRAKVLGGCSSHNSAIAFLAPDSDFEEWKQKGCPGWGPEEIQLYYNRMKQHITLTRCPPHNSLVNDFVQAAKEMKYPEHNFNTPEVLRNFTPGVGYFDLNRRGEIRCSSSVGYLHPTSTVPSNLKVITNVSVTKILFDANKKAIGVETEGGKFFCDKEVVLCCGAIDSPKLLLLSGVGPKEHLKQVGINVVADVPGVGENLLDHPEGVIIWETWEKVPEQTAQKYEVGMFLHVDPNQANPPGLSQKSKTIETWKGPNLMYHFGTEAFDMWTKPAGYPTSKNAFSLTPNVCKARSTGTIRLRSSSPKDPPKVDCKYFTDPENYDSKIMIMGIKEARKFAVQAPLSRWVKRELAPGPSVQSDEDIWNYIKKTHNTVYHPAGTCKMGTDPLAVVDPELRVRGVSGLRVADASVFPTMVTINPCMTVMMIGERCADFIQFPRTQSKL